MAGFGKYFNLPKKSRFHCNFRKIFENPEQAIIMFGGLQDAANLYASYDIRVECMVDLQGMFSSVIVIQQTDFVT